VHSEKETVGETMNREELFYKLQETLIKHLGDDDPKVTVSPVFDGVKVEVNCGGTTQYYQVRIDPGFLGARVPC
jgi:hypothetical protein